MSARSIAKPRIRLRRREAAPKESKKEKRGNALREADAELGREIAAYTRGHRRSDPRFDSKGNVVMADWDHYDWYDWNSQWAVKRMDRTLDNLQKILQEQQTAVEA
jgi:hypothetical protein